MRVCRDTKCLSANKHADQSMDCDRQVVLENRGYRSATWRTLRALQRVQGAKEIWGTAMEVAIEKARRNKNETSGEDSTMIDVREVERSF